MHEREYLVTTSLSRIFHRIQDSCFERIPDGSCGVYVSNIKVCVIARVFIGLSKTQEISIGPLSLSLLKM